MKLFMTRLRELALVQPDSSATGGAFLNALAGEHEIFKIIITSRAQTAIPSALWSSSYFVFIDTLLNSHHDSIHEAFIATLRVLARTVRAE